MKGPGAPLFEALERALGNLPIVAENLGVITPEVEALRQQFGFPGMAILQFAFGKDPQAPQFKPHNYLRDLVAYTGTHDNDTVVGWWTSRVTADSTRTPEDVEKEMEFARRYLNTDGREINWVMIRTLMASVADTVLFPLQDVLAVGSEGRMNLPGSPSGHWRWRFRADAPTPAISSRLRQLAKSTIGDRNSIELPAKRLSFCAQENAMYFEQFYWDVWHMPLTCWGRRVRRSLSIRSVMWRFISTLRKSKAYNTPHLRNPSARRLRLRTQRASGPHRCDHLHRQGSRRDFSAR